MVGMMKKAVEMAMAMMMVACFAINVMVMERIQMMARILMIVRIVKMARIQTETEMVKAWIETKVA